MTVEEIVENIKSTNPIKIKKYGAEKGTAFKSYMLLLVDYKPLVVYKDSCKYYAHIDVSTPDLTLNFFRKINSRNNLRGMNDYHDDIDLPLFLEALDKSRYFSQIFQNTSDDFQNDSFEYIGVVDELKAVLIESTSFRLIRDIQTKSSSNLALVADTYGISLADDTQANTKIRDWYYGHMLDANIELSCLFWNSLPAKPKEQQFMRIKCLNEFVPFMFKFKHILNPILDTNIWNELKSTREFFSEMYKISFAMNSNGTQLYDAEENSYALFTTRGALTKLFRFNIAPHISYTSVDSYNLSCFTSVVLYKALTDIDYENVYTFMNTYCLCVETTAQTQSDDDERNMIYDLDLYNEDIHIPKDNKRYEKLSYIDKIVWDYKMYLRPEMTYEEYIDFNQNLKAILDDNNVIRNLSSYKSLNDMKLSKSQNLRG